MPASPPAASRSVSARRVRHAETVVRSASLWTSAKPGIVSPLEMVRAPLVTRSTAERRPAVSSTQRLAGSAISELLW